MAKRDVLLGARDLFALVELSAALYMKQWLGRSRADVTLAEFLLYIEGQFDEKKKAEWAEKTDRFRRPERLNIPSDIAFDAGEPIRQEKYVGITDHICRGGQYIYPDCDGCQGRRGR